ncbi:MAG: hypothetical protein M1825_003648 [Sarcosagium campestre]|nr:MAG: hypothetical protein M1825_003648 [Sarcosagium campestre]
MTIADLKALVNSETSFPAESQYIYHNGQLIGDDSMTVERAGFHDGDMLAMHIRRVAGMAGTLSAGNQQSQSAQPQGRSGLADGNVDPEMIRLQILGDPGTRADLQRRNSELHDALEDPQRFTTIFQRLQRKQFEDDRDRQREIGRLNGDPFNPEAQAKIEELIRQENVMENLQRALEFSPEAFGRVYMLYINSEVNGHKVKAFVDSGAQATIMSPACAEACGITRLIDKRFAGIARGVGTANIIGRVHEAQIKIGSVFLSCSFTVMEGKDVDLLLGLDMLKRHLACIDLAKGVLKIQDVEVPFLGEADIPKNDEERLQSEPTVDGPGGIKVGAKSGAVMQAARPLAGPSSAGQGQQQASTSGASTSQPRPQSQAAPAQAASATSNPPPQYPKEAIDQLILLGFSRQEAIAALNATGGNVELAAGLLFQ